MRDIKKYLYEDYDNSNISIKYIEFNCKHDRNFNKFIKICMKYKIFLFHKLNDVFILRTNKYLIRQVNMKKSEFTAELGKMILKLHNFDKYLESTSDNFSDIYDTKNKIDQLYNEYNRNYRYLDELSKMLLNDFTDDILEKYINEEFSLSLKNNIIDEYSN